MKSHNKIAAFLTAGFMAAASLLYAGCTHRPVVKQDPLERRLEYIKNFYHRTYFSYSLFDDSRRNYFLVRRHLDDDNIKDYVLVVGLRTETDPDKKEYPHGFNALYIEDRSKDTNLGNIDRLCIYEKDGEVWKVTRFSVKKHDRYVEEYEALQRDSDKNKERLERLKYSISRRKGFLMAGNRTYHIALFFMEIILRQKEREFLID